MRGFIFDAIVCYLVLFGYAWQDKYNYKLLYTIYYRNLYNLIAKGVGIFLYQCIAKLFLLLYTLELTITCYAISTNI